MSAFCWVSSTEMLHRYVLLKLRGRQFLGLINYYTRLLRHRVSHPFTGKDVLNVKAKKKKTRKVLFKNITRIGFQRSY